MTGFVGSEAKYYQSFCYEYLYLVQKGNFKCIEFILSCLISSFIVNLDDVSQYVIKVMFKQTAGFYFDPNFLWLKMFGKKLFFRFQ